VKRQLEHVFPPLLLLLLSSWLCRRRRYHLHSLCLTWRSASPSPAKNCHWQWQTAPEKVVYLPFTCTTILLVYKMEAHPSNH
jgi:hypothetical protein